MRVLAAAAAALWLAGHSPYRQWDVYRRARLVLLATAADEASVRLARALVAIYERALPDSRPTYARARDANDQIRLLASGQLEVAVLHEAQAHAAFSAAPPYADNGRVELRALAALGDHLLVCLAQVPASAAYMLTEAVAERWQDLDPVLVRHAAGPKPPPDARVPLHEGARDFYRDHS